MSRRKKPIKVITRYRVRGGGWRILQVVSATWDLAHLPDWLGSFDQGFRTVRNCKQPREQA